MIEQIIHKIRKTKAFYFGKKQIAIPKAKKLVSFTFDDFPRSAYMNGSKILESHGLRGTFYTSMGLIEDNPGENGFFSLDDLLAIHKNGHEIGCHTYDHINCYYLTKEAIYENCKKNQRLINNLIGVTTKSFSYPYGDFNLPAKRVVSSLYTSSRTVKPGINISKIDLNALKSVPIYEARSKNNIFKWIEKLDETGGWLIFYTHDIKKNPSKFGCTIEIFQEVVAECIHREFTILSIKDIIESFSDS